MAQSANVSGVVIPLQIGTVTGNLNTRSEFLSTLESDFTTVFFTDFNEPAEFTFPDGTTTTIKSLYDIPHTEYQFQADAGFNTVLPQIMVQQSLLPDVIEPETSIKIRGVIYKIENYESNGVGVLTIFLRRH